MKIKYILNTATFFYLSLMIFFMISARPFAGLIVFGFTLGELIVGACLLLSLVILITPGKYLKKYFTFNDQFIYHKLIIIFFILLVLINKSEISNLYIFRSSSFIWTLSIIYISSVIMFNPDLFKYFIYIFAPIPIVNYLFATGNYPNFIINFYIKYSDKFQFIKASDLLMSYMVVNIILIFLNGVNNKTITYLCITSGLYFPLMLFNSRGAFISEVIFLILQVYVNRSFFKKSFKKVSLYCTLLILTTIGSSIYFGYSFDLIQVAPETQIIAEAVEGIAKNKNTKEAILGFYICENRLCSEDNTLDWRLDIWGDLVSDLNNKNRILTGYGFDEIFPIMLDPSAPGRLGRDGLNENVHNYFFNIMGRMGIIGLILIILFYNSLINMYQNRSKDFYLLSFLIPVFFNSFFDANMEGVQYPFLFFSTLGFIFFNNQINKTVT